MKVGIVGMGYVGRAVSKAVYGAGHTRYWYDKDTTGLKAFPNTTRFAPDGRADINECDIAFVCVPTPTRDDGAVDTSAVEEVLEWLDVPLIVIRSTVPADAMLSSPFGAGLCDVVYQPEFIGESPFAPWREESDVSLVVAGGEKAQEVLDFWKPILGPRVTYIATDWRTAAEIKYAVNCHGAVKAAWWREFLSGCADADAVRNGVMAIPWVEPYHTLPIGDGVGGKCLGKDLRAWVATHPGPIGKGALGYMSEAGR